MIKITGTLGTAFAVVLTAVVILFMFMVAKSIYKFSMVHIQSLKAIRSRGIQKQLWFPNGVTWKSVAQKHLQNTE